MGANDLRTLLLNALRETAEDHELWSLGGGVQTSETMGYELA